METDMIDSNNEWVDAHQQQRKTQNFNATKNLLPCGKNLA